MPLDPRTLDLRPRADQVGHRVAVRVVARRDNARPATATSAAVVILPGILRTARPTIAGTPGVGRRLVASARGWTPGTRFSYQ